mmetsp:Transcript_23456/g.73576  ORF Transcript_23456/g.73576 Transcript_23456/m.73576 type:complete len:234 (+) Transcript_23456:341-1042(+)
MAGKTNDTILKYDTAAVQTAGSDVKSETMGPAAKKESTPQPARMKLARVDPRRAACRACPSFPAPSHCPTTVAAAAPNPSVMTNARLSTRCPSPSAARLASPRPRRILPSIMYTKVKARPAPVMGPPMPTMFFMVTNSGTFALSCTPCFAMARTDSTSASQLDICVAIAAPATPMAGTTPPKPQMKMGSKIAFASTHNAVTPSTGRMDPMPLKPAATTPDAMSGIDPSSDHRR